MKSIDEIFGGSWHKDWQDLPEECKAWLIEKNAACDSRFTEARIEARWNLKRGSNLRQQEVDMLEFRSGPDFTEKSKEIDSTINAQKQSKEYLEWLISRRIQLKMQPEEGGYNGNSLAKIDADIQSAEAVLIERTALLDALLGNSEEVDLPSDNRAVVEQQGQPIESGQKAAPRTKLDLQIGEIVQAALSLNFDLMSIPSGGKRRVKDICLKNRAAIGSVHVFDRAWQTASQTNKIKSSVSGS